MIRPASGSLHFGFQQIPDEGMLIEFEENFGNLYRANEQGQRRSDGLEEAFCAPIKGRAEVFRVGSKVDVRGQFSSQVKGLCDRCTGRAEHFISGDWSIFLMPQEQFSKHDKPGGKVIHGPTRDIEPSRHHSSSKAEILTDAEGEHEDVSFGAFDGQTVDLRPVLREELILEIPMRFLCSEDCQGLCLECGHNKNTGLCAPTCPTRAQETPKGPLAQALAQKFQK